MMPTIGKVMSSRKSINCAIGKLLITRYEKIDGFNYLAFSGIVHSQCQGEYWNPEKGQGGLNVNGNTYCPSFIGLIHEIAHATSEMYGFSDYSTWVILSNGKNVKNDEKWATYVENLVRGEQNVPYRKYYAHYDDTIFHSGVPETLICEQSRTNSGFVSLYSMDIKMNELMKLLWTSCGRYGY